MNTTLLNALDSHGFVEVLYTTKVGHERMMHCTRHLSTIPEEHRDGINSPKLNGPVICCVYDWLNGAWRAFRWDSVNSWGICA